MCQAIDEWTPDHRMLYLNDGAATKHDNATGVCSAPDITMISEGLADRANWTVLEDVGSDHLPLLTVLTLGRRTDPALRPMKRWCLRKANWTAYREAIRQALVSLDPTVADSMDAY
jgi:hypothetical protein